MGRVSIVFALLCISCNTQSPAFEENNPIPEGVWNKDNIVSITMPVVDTTQHYNMQLYLRNRNDYRYSNLYMFVTVTAPTGAVVTDTVQYMLADDHGKWLGKGGSQLWDNRFAFRSNILFAAKGDYHIQIRHGMRDIDLIGVTDVGVRLLERE